MNDLNRLRNPFRPTRWDHEAVGKNLIWFTRNAERLLEDKPVYVYGTRGSGKTTLLKSVCWEDLVKNESLMMQRGLEDSDFIGVYIRLPDHVRGSMGKADWSKIYPDSPDLEYEEHMYFSLAIESICCQKVLEAVTELQPYQYLTISAKDELTLVQNVLTEFPKLADFSDRRPETFKELILMFKNLVRRMNQATGRGELQKILPRLPEREPNELVSYFCKRLSEVSTLNRRPNHAVRFKFCIDDCEVMSSLQLKSTNTLLRKSQSPISWVLCSVGELADIASTFSPEQPITGDDRLVVPLNVNSRSEFKELCQAVASLRLYFTLPPSVRPKVDKNSLSTFFNPAVRFGESNVNIMFQRLMKDSKNSLSDTLRDTAEKVKHEFSLRETPYYKTYILAHWNGVKSGDNKPKETFDANVREDEFRDRVKRNTDNFTKMPMDEWLRRKQTAALMHFASRLGSRGIGVFGYDAIVSLSDRSIRDFLEFLASIYDEYLNERLAVRTQSNTYEPEAEQRQLITSVQRFVDEAKPVNIALQTAGIYQSSEALFAQIKSQTDDYPEMLTSLVDALGRYTELLQANHEDAAMLATAERGVFYIQHPPSNDEFLALVETLIRRAALAGYLRFVPLKSQLDLDSSLQKRFQGFRLRKRFAPKFGFSYRGAYEIVPLEIDFFEAALRPTATNNIQTWINKRRVVTPTVGTEQLSLPLEIVPEIAGEIDD